MINWPEKLANDLSNSFECVDVYSNVDPNREYNGGKTIEFNVQRLDTLPTITSAILYDFQLLAACRAPSYSEALALVNAAREELKPLLDGYVDSGDAVSTFISTQEVTPDARGLIEGESFYGLLNFAIQEIERA